MNAKGLSDLSAASLAYSTPSRNRSSIRSLTLTVRKRSTAGSLTTRMEKKTFACKNSSSTFATKSDGTACSRFCSCKGT